MPYAFNPLSGQFDLIEPPVDISGKQDKLVSGTNIKTINGTSILGSGDMTISGGGGTTDYHLQNEDRDTSYAYVGYKDPSDKWYIYRRTRATNLRQYATGTSGYSTNWTNKSSLIYT